MRQLCVLIPLLAVWDAGCSSRRGDGELPPLEEVAAQSDYRARWAVAIGINDYPSEKTGLRRLKAAANDAVATARILREEFGFAGGRGRRGEVKLLTNATKQEIEAALGTWLPSKATDPADCVLVFFSGHGEPSPDGGLLLAGVDAQREKPESWVRASWVREQLSSLPCRHKAVIFDSCHSGKLFSKEVVRTADVAGGAQFAPLGRESSGLLWYLHEPAFLGISAGREGGVGDTEHLAGHSCFTKHLLAALGECAHSEREDHAFTFKELAALVRMRVEIASKGSQVPRFGQVEAGDGDLVLRPVRQGRTPLERAGAREYFDAVDYALRCWELGDAGQGEIALDHCPAAMRGWEWYYCKRLFGRGVQVLPTEGAANVVALSPDGSLVAAGFGKREERGKIIVWDAQRGTRVATLLSDGPAVRALAIHLGNSLLMTGDDDGTVRFWRVREATETRRVAAHRGPVHSAVFSADGRLAASGGEDGRVTVFDGGDGSRLQAFAAGDERIVALAVLADGRLASVDGAGTLQLRNATDGTLLETVAEPPGFQDICVSSDGRLLSGSVRRPRGVRELGRPGESSAAAHDGDSKRVMPDGRGWLTVGKDNCIQGWDEGGELRYVLRGHRGTIRDLAASRDGQRIASVSEDRSLRVWRAGPAEPASTLEGARCAAFDASGARLVVAGEGPALVVRGGRDGEAATTVSGHRSPVVWASFDRGGTRVLSIAADGVLLVSDAGTGGPLLRVKGRARLCCGVLGADDRTLITGDEKGLIQFWNAGDGTERPETLRTSGGAARRVAVSPDGRLVAAAVGKYLAWPSNVGLWRLASAGDGTGDPDQSLVFPPAAGEHGPDFQDVAFSPDGQLLAAAGGEQGVLLWEVATGRHTFLRRHPSPVVGVGFSPDGKRIVSAGRAVDLWDVADRRWILSLPHQARQAMFDIQGEWIVSAGDKDVRLWDGGPTAEYADLHVPACDAAFSPKGHWLALGCLDGKVRFWDPMVPEEKAAIENAHEGAVRAVAWAESFVASAGDDGRVVISDSVVPAKVMASDDLGAPVTCVAVRPGGNELASGGLDGAVRVWDASSLRAARKLGDHRGGVDCIGYSPDGRALVSGGADGCVRLWNLESGQRPTVLKGHEKHVHAVAFRHDGRRLASAGEDGTVRIWDPGRGEPLLVFREHGNRVRGVAWNPQIASPLVASVSWDDTLLVWDADTGRVVRRVRRPLCGASRLHFSADGSLLVVAGDEDTIVWNWGRLVNDRNRPAEE